MISEVERQILRRWSPEPEYGCNIKIGLDIYKYYVCKLRGLCAFSREHDSLLRCVSGAGEAGASYVNK